MLGGMDVRTRDDQQARDRPTPTSVTLGLTLTAAAPDDDDEIFFPLDMGEVMARVTFTDRSGRYL